MLLTSVRAAVAYEAPTRSSIMALPRSGLNARLDPWWTRSVISWFLYGRLVDHFAQPDQTGVLGSVCGLVTFEPSERTEAMFGRYPELSVQVVSHPLFGISVFRLEAVPGRKTKALLA